MLLKRSTSPRPALSSRRLLTLARVVAAAVLALAACSVEYPQDARYVCADDSDCGGDDHRCVASRTGGYCCKPAAEICDGLDNDCNGVADDLPPEPCYDGPSGTLGVGTCRAGQPVCQDGRPVCHDQLLPLREVCNDLDDDCNGQVDDAPGCT